MKIICTQENLKNGLLATTKIITSNNTLPILNNILLKTENGQLKIYSTNLEMAVSAKVRCKIENEGQTTIQAKTFQDLVNNLTGENIELTALAGEVCIKTDNQEFKLKTLPAEEFPTVPETTKTPKLNIKSSELKQALMQSVYAVSLNQTQPEISGVFMSSTSGEVVVVATDRYRLVERKLAGPEFPSVIIPHKTIQEVIRILSGFVGEVGVVIEENQIFFNIGEVLLISRLVDGQYPDYKSIFPESFISQVVVDKEKLQNALRTTALLSQSTNSVRLEFLTSKQQIILSSQSEGLGSGVASLDCEVKGQDGSLLLNYKYVLDFLSQVEEAQIELKINNDSSPAVFSPLGSKQYNYLVMPIKI